MLARIRLLVSLFVLVGFFVGCGNPYMEVGTPEYNKYTSNVINGTWNIKSYKIGDTEMIGGVYDSATVTFDFKTKKAKFLFIVNREDLKENVKQWQEKWPNLQVTKFDIDVTTGWKIKEPDTIAKVAWGDLMISFDNIEYNLIIEGSGDNFQEGFVAYEKTKFAASTLTGGMIGNMVNNAAKKGSLGIHPALGNFRFSMNSDNEIHLESSKLDFPHRSAVLVK